MSDFEALGRYTQHMERLQVISEQRRKDVQLLQRLAANASPPSRGVMLLQLDELEAVCRRLREQQHELEQLGQVINQLAQQLGRPGVSFVPHRVL